jgi:2-polyprenyl-3-methyl-5-hydroxy-6-metoxy-1,4-benzoquinol methylase
MNEGAFESRLEQIAPFIAGKSVLDVGCTSAFGRPDWIHAGIATRARRVVGVDIDPAAVAKVCEAGYDVRLADAETLAIDEQFEVVHAGELIEHLDNPRAFLQAARTRLAPGGILVLTTPNVFAVSNFVYRIGGTPRVNADHTCWYCEDTLSQLLERNGFQVREVRYLRHPTPGTVRPIVAQGLRRLLSERLAWNTLLVVAEPVVSLDA